jgi:phospholipase/carboxylesterase
MPSFQYLSRASKISNAPLLVMLHGYSSNEADLFSFASLIPNDYHVVSLQAPLSLGIGYAWFPIHFEENMERWTSPQEAQKAIEYVNSFLTYYTEKYDVNNSNITLLGFSQGGHAQL